MVLDALLQQLVGGDALRAADDLAVAFGREDVHAERVLRIVRIGLHVEGLHRGGIAVHHDRPVELRGDVGLVGRAEVVAVLEGMLDQALGVRLVQHGGGLVVAQAREGRLDRLQLRDVAFDAPSGRAGGAQARGPTMKLRKFSASTIRSSRPA